MSLAIGKLFNQVWNIAEEKRMILKGLKGYNLAIIENEKGFANLFNTVLKYIFFKK